jgi:hypothetical protein
VLRRSLRRVNALSAVLLLAAAAIALCSFAPPLLALLPFVLIVLVCRLAFVAPALVLEDTRVLGSFARSWQLTRGHFRLAFGLMLRSALLFYLSVLVAAFFASAGAATIAAGGTLGGIVLATIVGLAVGFVPVVVSLTVIGVGWAFLYEDLRRQRPPGTR